MKIEMYVLCLLKFKDGRIVFKSDELESINVAITNGLKKRKLFIVDKNDKKSGDVFKVYRLDPKKIEPCLRKSAKIESAEIGYYHHRVIAYLRLDSADDFSKLREVRDRLKKLVDKLIERGVKDQINKLICAGTVREEAEVEFFYTYPLTVVKKRRKRSEAFPFSEETSTLCFDIIEPSWFPPTAKRHMMRISIPGTILYSSSWGVSTELRRDIVNVIYQYCLYEKKSMDKLPFKNVLDENLLANLWTQIVNRIGGRMIEAHTIRLNFLTILLIILTAISVIILIFTLILPYLGDY
jgi:hypothetical protein